MLLLQRDQTGKGASRESMTMYRWALMRAEPVRWFTPEEMLLGLVDVKTEDLVVGSVECLTVALRQLGAHVPEPDYYPESLRPHLHREVCKRTVREVRQRLVDGETLFVKSHAWKRLTGCVLSPSDTDKLDELYQGEQLWVSEPVKFVAEWRMYALGGIVQGVSQYGEVEDIKPGPRELDLMTDGLARLRQEQPRCAYVLDWGLLSDGTLALVEVGDAWAVGCYAGIPAHRYAECLQARWREIVQARTDLAGAHGVCLPLMRDDQGSLE